MSPGAFIAIAFWAGLTVVCLVALAWMVVHAGREEDLWPSESEPARRDDDFAWGVAIAMDDPTPADRRHRR